MVEFRQRGAHLFLGLRSTTEPRESRAVFVGDREEAREELVLRRPAPDGEEVDDLDQQPRLAAGALAHALDQTLEPGEEAIVPDAQQRTGRHVADARRLDHQHAGAAVGEAAVPVEHFLGDEALLVRAPRHHRRNPAARARFERAEAAGLEQATRGRRGGVGPARFGERMGADMRRRYRTR
ncbi:MAG: hypothetical protein H6831_02205 [Planctomycetes bacterium]|nr:hypothetical protein [Planctomycetota bacterium]